MRKFIKAHGLGNDFIIIDNRFMENEGLDLNPELASLLADRKIGIGCDQILLLDETPNADIKMRIINSDGGEVEACGNATRCVAYYEGMKQDKKAISVETIERILPSTIVGKNQVNVDMGQAELVKNLDYKNMQNCYWVDIGNPHLIHFTDSIDSFDIAGSKAITEDTSTFPNRINFTVAEITGANQLRIKTCERGVGITEACGTAACSAAYAYNLQQNRSNNNKIDVSMLGGDVVINVVDNNNIHMQGACVVGNFAGYFSELDYLESKNA